MTRLNVATYSLFPAIIIWGILLGGIVYSHIAFFPVYLSDLPNSAVVVNGKYAINEVPFWMTVHPLLILSLIIALALNWKFKARRKLIALSFGIYIVVLIVSAVYFVPELMAFAKSPESNLPASEWLARGHRWYNLSLIRGSWCFIGFVPLLIALSKPAVEPQTSEKPSPA
ncbi:MAG TPA: hypothetical protein VF648_02370 [Pyrinomonadaceae bacterium]|jgi:cellulose synthase/poly-beta-1,6-N-acetylglucosamine synthase-like glycosyltransferase